VFVFVCLWFSLSFLVDDDDDDDKVFFGLSLMYYVLMLQVFTRSTEDVNRVKFFLLLCDDDDNIDNW
jgi:hypothetical protein